MAVDGVWTGEIYSDLGWERSGVFTLEDGRPDRPEYDLQVRMTRRMDLPA